MKLGCFYIHRKWQIDVPNEIPLLVIHKTTTWGQQRILWVRFPKFMRKFFVRKEQPK